MCRNIIFDYGNTIVEFEPKNIIRRFGVTDPGDVETLYEIVFDLDYWKKLDRGDVTQEQFKKDVLPALPERLRGTAAAICDEWITNLPFIDGMDTLIHRLKKDGYRLYLLSNISRHFAQNSEKIEIFKEFDGLVFSGAIGLVKPDREIFDYLLKTYGLAPGQTLFIDDNSQNVAAAQSLGIRSLLFDGDSRKAQAFIDAHNA